MDCVDRVSSEAIDTDDSGIEKHSYNLCFLFLITLFYSIGATFVKVYNLKKKKKLLILC